MFKQSNKKHSPGVLFIVLCLKGLLSILLLKNVRNGLSKNNYPSQMTHLVTLLSRDLELKKPIFQKTSTYGHFGRKDFTWEQPKELKF